ncbi:hypothetical protein E2C01_019499 [Portunus trituberculatus]|uniref:Uncharacterized protein n=1 Tax=Portunus trituberculatus TaxID=210409 RepID=A0A5B7DYG1_PORTR|nr:hypothetical protein [Portunus trituberculatus]
MKWQKNVTNPLDTTRTARSRLKTASMSDFEGPSSAILEGLKTDVLSVTSLLLLLLLLRLSQH